MDNYEEESARLLKKVKTLLPLADWKRLKEARMMVEMANHIWPSAEGQDLLYQVYTLQDAERADENAEKVADRKQASEKKKAGRAAWKLESEQKKAAKKETDEQKRTAKKEANERRKAALAAKESETESIRTMLLGFRSSERSLRRDARNRAYHAKLSKTTHLSEDEKMVEKVLLCRTSYHVLGWTKIPSVHFGLIPLGLHLQYRQVMRGLKGNRARHADRAVWRVRAALETLNNLPRKNAYDRILMEEESSWRTRMVVAFGMIAVFFSFCLLHFGLFRSAFLLAASLFIVYRYDLPKRILFGLWCWSKPLYRGQAMKLVIKLGCIANNWGSALTAYSPL